MGTLAQMFADRGYTVSGSDSGIYPPMSDILHSRGISLTEGYSGENVLNTDLVIIGNAVSRGNPEVEAVLNRRIPYMSMARALREFFLADKEIICVSGTHGKSTTASILTNILKEGGMNPSMFIGAVVQNFNSSYLLDEGGYFVIEGDEYDSAFFEKYPKFNEYRPHHLIATSLEFDHADIYNNLEEIELWFSRLVRVIPSEGNIVYCSDYPVLEKIMSHSMSRIFSYGSGEADFMISSSGYPRIERSDGESAVGVESGLTGVHNLLNMAGAAAMALSLGVDKSAVEKGLASFKGVKRRLELIYENSLVKIYEDFAHHPTAIEFVLESLRKSYPSDALVAVYEPRSATSRRNVLAGGLSRAFSKADRVIMKSLYAPEKILPEERLDINDIIYRISKSGIYASCYDDVADIIAVVLEEVKKNAAKNIRTCVVIMSNGGFDGIYKKIIKSFTIFDIY